LFYITSTGVLLITDNNFVTTYSSVNFPAQELAMNGNLSVIHVHVIRFLARVHTVAM